MATATSDALPLDIFVDANGKLWRVVARIDQPSIEMEEIEPSMPGNGRVRKRGATTARTWDGFKLIHRQACEHKFSKGMLMPEGGHASTCDKCGELVKFPE